MVVRTYDSKDAIGAAAATLFAACVIRKPHAVLGLATGSTPIPTYQKMAELYRMGAVDFSGVTTFNLDEYVGLNHEHEQSYYYFMMENLFLPYQCSSLPNSCSVRHSGRSGRRVPDL